jgi:hypothetical protein
MMRRTFDRQQFTVSSYEISYVYLQYKCHKVRSAEVNQTENDKTSGGTSMRNLHSQTTNGCIFRRLCKTPLIVPPPTEMISSSIHSRSTLSLNVMQDRNKDDQ